MNEDEVGVEVEVEEKTKREKEGKHDHGNAGMSQRNCGSREADLYPIQ